MDSRAAGNLPVPMLSDAARQNADSATVTTSDTVYRDLLGTKVWARLPSEVRQRFSVRPTGRQRICYSGVMQRVELSFFGWLFAQTCRLFGTPLAPHRGRNVKMEISLSWEEALHGVTWQRTYYFVPDRKFTVRSTKSRGMNNDLIEHIGHGFSMRLALSERNGRLVFTSTRYEVRIGGRQLRIPAFLTPGVTTVIHEQVAGDCFRFSLSVDHPLLGRTIFQEGEFRSAPENPVARDSDF